MKTTVINQALMKEKNQRLVAYTLWRNSPISRTGLAKKTGLNKATITNIIADLTDEMCDEIIVPSVMMDAKYEKYLLGTAFARPVIGKKLAEIALAEGADAIAHGATGSL